MWEEPRESLHTERLWIKKEMRRLLGKMFATSCLGWKELILIRVFIRQVAGMVCNGFRYSHLVTSFFRPRQFCLNFSVFCLQF